MSHSPKRWLAALLAASVVLVASCERGPDPEEEARTAAGVAAQRDFFHNLRNLCGQTFAGSTLFASAPDHPMGEGTLRMIVESCTDTEIRIPFHVENDRSRTWILTLTDEGLLFKHDHRHEDGTPEDLTNYGGWASVDGTGIRQSFPADAETAAMLPEAETNVWTLEIDPLSNEFIYDLTRHGQPRFRAAFDLTNPVPNAGS